MPELLINALLILLKIVVIQIILITCVAFAVYGERKVSAFIQDRVGPNRVGPLGLLQPFVDVGKLLFKEDIVPLNADKFVHSLAPIISALVSLCVIAVIPFGNTITIFGREFRLYIADVNIGILYVLALLSMGVYGITLSGWSSNSKYSLLGGIRSSAQMLSYELSMGLAVLGVVLVTGSFSLIDIVKHQAGWHWNIILQPVGFIVFLTASFAETNRSPFDLPEAEQELVGGYHTEYSSMKFALFFVAEYANIIISSCIMTTLFFGGYQFPYLETFGLAPFWVSIIQIITFLVKASIILFTFIWVRWTLLRFRYDQLMHLGWYVMLPISLANLAVTAIVIYLLK
ncbi:MAG TPA: NADH-quinone oxidoreductase subunit NuoH [Ignavibacteria bacterium]|nr:NADH-quinone oxidoreductase subunit NuoH [Ignavibacteria bacterium]